MTLLTGAAHLGDKCPRAGGGLSFCEGAAFATCHVVTGETLGKSSSTPTASLLELRGTPDKLCVPSLWRKPTGTPGRKARGMVTTAKIGTIRSQAPKGIRPWGRFRGQVGGRLCLKQTWLKVWSKRPERGVTNAVGGLANTYWTLVSSQVQRGLGQLPNSPSAWMSWPAS